MGRRSQKECEALLKSNSKLYILEIMEKKKQQKAWRKYYILTKDNSQCNEYVYVEESEEN